MITITTDQVTGIQHFSYNGESLVRLETVESVRGGFRYSVTWGKAMGLVTSDAGEAFGEAMDRAFAMMEDMDNTARMRENY